MCYIGGPIYPHEELKAGMLDAAKTPCSVCTKPCWGECSNCYAPMCDECAVQCAGCASDNSYCLSCAVRNGYVEINDKQYCENCAGEFEPELEEIRR